MALKKPQTPLDWHNLEFMYEVLYLTNGDISTILNIWPDQMEMHSFIDSYKELLGDGGI